MEHNSDGNIVELDNQRVYTTSTSSKKTLRTTKSGVQVRNLVGLSTISRISSHKERGLGSNSSRALKRDSVGDWTTRLFAEEEFDRDNFIDESMSNYIFKDFMLKDYESFGDDVL